MLGASISAVTVTVIEGSGVVLRQASSVPLSSPETRSSRPSLSRSTKLGVLEKETLMPLKPEKETLMPLKGLALPVCSVKAGAVVLPVLRQARSVP